MQGEVEYLIYNFYSLMIPAASDLPLFFLSTQIYDYT